MNLQYVTDTEGRHTAVLIPIEEWESLASKYKELKELEKPAKKLSEKYAGKLPAHIADELQAYVTQSRKEWNNNPGI